MRICFLHTRGASLVCVALHWVGVLIGKPAVSFVHEDIPASLWQHGSVVERLEFAPAFAMACFGKCSRQTGTSARWIPRYHK